MKSGGFMRRPDFNNILKVLNKEKPSRPTLFEYFMNDIVHDHFSDRSKFIKDANNPVEEGRHHIESFKNAGYDYAQLIGSAFKFKYKDFHQEKSRSLNSSYMISDEESFLNYKWPNPEDFDYSKLEILGKELPDGMKLIVSSAESVYGGASRLIGFDNLCYMLGDERELVKQIWDEIGSRMLKYNQIISQFDSVGAVIVNDDWGFNTQTMISPKDLREFVFPWHKKIVEAIHKTGKPAILHSCGNLKEVFPDIIEDMKYDGKHSYEDVICPVESMYDQWGGKIGIMGGMDVDFIIRSSPEDIKKRARAMFERASEKGSYALGSGNSIADYVPLENYIAMIDVVKEY